MQRDQGDAARLLLLTFVFVLPIRCTKLNFGMSAWGTAGTVVGLLLDFDSGAFLVTTNGDFTPPNGGCVVASGLVPGEAVGSGLYPALSAKGCTLRVNLGQRPFRFQPSGYKDTWAAASAVKVQVFSRVPSPQGLPRAPPLFSCLSFNIHLDLSKIGPAEQDNNCPCGTGVATVARTSFTCLYWTKKEKISD